MLYLYACHSLIFVIVCIFMFGCVHVCAHMRVYIWKLELITRCLLQNLHLVVFNGVSHCTWSLTGWLTISRDPWSQPSQHRHPNTTLTDFTLVLEIELPYWYLQGKCFTGGVIFSLIYLLRVFIYEYTINPEGWGNRAEILSPNMSLNKAGKSWNYMQSDKGTLWKLDIRMHVNYAWYIYHFSSKA